ncbi:MAG: class I SAM-dependent methyltransferase [Acidimicrobiales bacterium]
MDADLSLAVPSADRALYTHGHHQSVLRAHGQRSAANSAAYLLPHLSPGMSVLDVGCGGGTITKDLAQVVSPGGVVALDRSQRALEVARECCSGLANVAFEACDVLALPFGDASFDVVHAHQVLQHPADPVAAIDEMARVCKDEGLIAARDGDYASMAWFPHYAELDRWIDLYRGTARACGGEPDAGRHLCSWAQAARCARIVTPASAWCFSTPEDRRLWAHTWAERVADSSLASHAVEFGLADATELAWIAQGWRRWAEEPDGWFALTHGELLCRPR